MIDKKKRSNNNSLFFLAFVILVGIAVLFGVIFGYEKRTDTRTTITSGKQESLVCNSGPREDAFFSMEGASQVNHQVKFLLINDKISKLFYMYRGKFRDNDNAERFITRMHIKYDTYLAEHNESVSHTLESAFSYPDTEARIDIYTSAGGINPSTAVFFFLKEDDLNAIMKKNIDELKMYLLQRNFNCVTND